MKTRKILLTIAAGLTATITGACGQYTNFPAQYHVAGDSDLVATISYAGGAATVKFPKLVVKGEPGSIGATFDRMNVNYNSGEVSAANIPISFRVDSSHLRDTSGNPVVSGGTFNLPIINSRIVELGRRQSVNNLSATVTLEGTDDAAWPTTLQVNVPIVFLPTSSAPVTPVAP